MSSPACSSIRLSFLAPATTPAGTGDAPTALSAGLPGRVACMTANAGTKAGWQA